MFDHYLSTGKEVSTLQTNMAKYPMDSTTETEGSNEQSTSDTCPNNSSEFLRARTGNPNREKKGSQRLAQMEITMEKLERLVQHYDKRMLRISSRIARHEHAAHANATHVTKVEQLM